MNIHINIILLQLLAVIIFYLDPTQAVAQIQKNNSMQTVEQSPDRTGNTGSRQDEAQNSTQSGFFYYHDPDTDADVWGIRSTPSGQTPYPDYSGDARIHIPVPIQVPPHWYYPPQFRPGLPDNPASPPYPPYYPDEQWRPAWPPIARPPVWMPIPTRPGRR